MDIAAHNRRAWDGLVEQGDPWTLPVSPKQVERARRGDVSIVLTPVKPIPRAWLGELRGARVLALASSGGQQAPLLAAAGARVTVLDNSPRQLAQDRLVAERENLSLELVQGDMRDLSPFADGSFDLIVHPVSNCFVPDIAPVWREAHRVLRPGGTLLAGFCNPVMYVFDTAAEQRGELVVRHRLPYSDLASLTEEERLDLERRGVPYNFGHTLEQQIGGQLEAGFTLTGFYEDTERAPRPTDLAAFMPVFAATRAVR